MAEKTPGLLELDPSQEPYSERDGYRVMSRRYGRIAFVAVPLGYEKEAKATAVRFVACWNACEGINPEAVPELLKALQRIADVSAGRCY